MDAVLSIPLIARQVAALVVVAVVLTYVLAIPLWWPPSWRWTRAPGARIRVVALWKRARASDGAVVMLAVAGVVLAAVGLVAAFPWLTAVWIVVSVLALAAGAVAIRAQRARDLRDLAFKAPALANELRAFLQEVSEWPARITTGPSPHFDDMAVQHYAGRFQSRVRRVAKELRRFKAVSTDVFFRHIDDGPSTEHDIFQIAAGLERLAKQLPED